VGCDGTGGPDDVLVTGPAGVVVGGTAAGVAGGGDETVTGDGKEGGGVVVVDVVVVDAVVVDVLGVMDVVDVVGGRVVLAVDVRVVVVVVVVVVVASADGTACTWAEGAPSPAAFMAVTSK
jgi:hypothetical protein